MLKILKIADRWAICAMLSCLVFAAFTGVVDYLILIKVSVSPINTNEFFSLLVLKLVISLILICVYSITQVRVEICLKQQLIYLDDHVNPENYLISVSKDIAFNFVTGLLRIISESLLLSIFVILILINYSVSNMPYYLVVACVLFLAGFIFMKGTDQIRHKAAIGQVKMNTLSSPFIVLKDQFKSLNAHEFVGKKIATNASEYLRYNSIALSFSQFPRPMVDVIILIGVFVALQNDLNMMSLGVIGMRFVSSLNSIINLIPIVLHYAPYTKMVPLKKG